MMDVTDRKQASDEVGLRVVVSHQLDAVVGMNWMLELAAQSPGCHRRRATTSRTRANQRRLATLVNDLLDISRSRAGACRCHRPVKSAR